MVVLKKNQSHKAVQNKLRTSLLLKAREVVFLLAIRREQQTYQEVGITSEVWQTFVPKIKDFGVNVRNQTVNIIKMTAKNTKGVK